MSTSRSPAFSGPSKKISSWVRPGVCEVRASALRPVSALISEDLPTLERPAKATSRPAIGGSVSIEGEAQTNCQSPANSFRPCSISSALVSAVMREASMIVPHGEEALLQRHLEPRGPDGYFGPILRDAAKRPLLRMRESWWTDPSLRRLLRREGGLQIVEQLHLHAVAAHDEALLQHRQQVVPGPVDHKPGREARQHEGEDQRHPVEDHLLG